MKTIWQCGLAIGCILSASVAGFAEPVQRTAITRDATWALHLDVDALRSTAVGKHVLTELEKPEEQAKFFAYQMFLSFDPRKSLHGITLYGTTANPNDSVALIYADFDPAHLTRLAEMAEDHKATTNGQHVIHSWIDAKRREKEGGEPRSYAAIHTKAVLFGQEEQRVAETLNALEGRNAGLNPGVLFPNSTAGAGVPILQGGAVKIEMQGAEPHAAVFRQAKAMSLNVAEMDGKIVGTLNLDAVNEEVSKHMATVARGLVSLLALQTDKPETVQFARSLSVVEEGARTVIKVSLSSDEVVKAMTAAAAQKAIAEKSKK